MRPLTGSSWTRDSSPQMTWDQAVTVKFCHLHAQSRRSRRELAENRGFHRILGSWHSLATSRLLIILLHSIQIDRLSESTALLNGSSWTFLKNARFWWAVVFWGADFPGSRLAVRACLRRMRLTFIGGHTNPSSNVVLMHALMGQCKIFMPCANQCRMGHFLDNLWKSEISVKLQHVLKCEVEKVGMTNQLRSFLGRPSYCCLSTGASHSWYRVNFRPLALKKSMTHLFLWYVIWLGQS